MRLSNKIRGLYKNTKKGFTLAEVLITLTIIGIVSATTLPSLNSNVNDRALTTQARKTYNTLNNAVDMCMNNNDAENVNSLQNFTTDNAQKFVENYLKPVSKEAKFTKFV